MTSKLTWRDFVLASLVAVVLTWHPYYLHGRLNLFELGLYLPGIDGILQGQVPFRDFFYLRGPLDLYLPALLMKVFGHNVAVLCTYFYVGTVITLIVCVLIAREVLPSRILLYTLIPMLVVRTFPRVVFTYWGGLRYAWGLLAVWCLVRFLKTGTSKWIFGAAAFTAAAGFTSPEVGLSAFVASVIILAWDRRAKPSLAAYGLGLLAAAAPFCLYLVYHHALGDYLNSQWIVATQLTKTFLQTEPVPSNLAQVIHALVIPGDKNFRQMTPVYCYIAFAFYVLWRSRGRSLDWRDKAVTAIALYGFFIYVTGFRNLWANVFEMALQPEKIVLFYLLAQLIAQLSVRERFKKFAYMVLAAVIISSLVYTVGRIQKRFLFFRKDPLQGQQAQRMDLPELKGMVIPQNQAQDIVQLRDIVQKFTPPTEAVWMYPELGAMHFILNRPWVGKFPTPTLSWVDEQWHRRYMDALASAGPRYLIVDRQVPTYFDAAYFPVAGNRAKFAEQIQYIDRNYSLFTSTPSYNVFVRRKPLAPRSAP